MKGRASSRTSAFHYGAVLSHCNDGLPRGTVLSELHREAVLVQSRSQGEAGDASTDNQKAFNLSHLLLLFASIKAPIFSDGTVACTAQTRTFRVTPNRNRAAIRCSGLLVSVALNSGQYFVPINSSLLLCIHFVTYSFQPRLSQGSKLVLSARGVFVRHKWLKCLGREMWSNPQHCTCRCPCLFLSP
jgi:hypothetical protein